MGMFSRDYRDEVEVVGITDRNSKRQLLDLYQEKCKLSDQHYTLFEVNRDEANKLYRKIRAIEDEMDLLKAKTGTQLRYKN